ncbi:MbnP family protein [Hymenobacter ruricola]|uniref:Copper-binding protein MbnP-like domain-containing protein n=1 Tax=Hymenobacter ruricola TaxID=2791023 RepID=A0ABS0I897_9BACT|nr:MbnP family protein [Hymenobacter ruricola]MBF9222996.1 hypothetical protein [Hymenobacter ruricola]
MKFSAFSVLSGAFALATISLTGCKKDEPVASSATEFTLHMDNGVTMPVAGSTTPKFTSLVLGSGTYKNANGDDFTVSTLKYYISNVKLNKADGSSYAVPNTYFLVDHSKPDSQDLTMTDVPEGEYSSVSFVVGVDSIRSKAGNFGGGVLNASNGMLWDMNGAPEFINFKLEGKSPQAITGTNPSGSIVFHVAGYLHSTTNTIRTVTVPFTTSKLIIARDHTPEVHMQVEVANLFGKPLNPPTNPVPPINFATTYTIMSGIPASRLADNIQTSVFSVGHIHAN